MICKLLFGLALALSAGGAQAQNYTATQGTGTTFGSKLVSTVNYPQIVFCDPVTPAQCVGVNSSGQMTVLLGAGSAIIGNVRIDQTTPGTTNGVQVNAGSAIIGKVGIDQTTPGTTNAVAVTTSTPEGTLADAPATLPATTTNASVIALLKALANVGQYPSGAVAITASATGTTAATTATLAGTTGKTTYICSYSIRANATAATTVQNTVTGVITATMTHQMWVAPAASGIGIDEQVFNPCVPASATNTAIAVVSGAPGSGGLVSATATGYQL